MGKKVAKLKIKYFTDDITKISDMEKDRVAKGKGDWIDLYAAKDVEIAKGGFALIPLGIGIALPKGYEAIVAPRSSTYKHFGIIQVNSIGIIDESYCGDNDQWMMPVLATRDTVIHKNDRICQFRIIKHQPVIEFEETNKLGDKDRGGFGSTGI